MSVTPVAEKQKIFNTDNSCESILSSINEECSKITNAHENSVSNSPSSDQTEDTAKKKDVSKTTQSLRIFRREFAEGSVNGDDNPGNNEQAKNPTIKLKIVNASLMASTDTKNKQNGQQNIDVSKVNGDDSEARVNDSRPDQQNHKSSVNSLDNNLSNDGEQGENSPKSNSLVIDEKLVCKEEISETEGQSKKIKLRSFASLCMDDEPLGGENKVFSEEISGVAVGDIVQHGNMFESDESGVMHLKISNVVGGEDCITGICMEENDLSTLKIGSISSLIDPISPDGKGNELSGETVSEDSSLQTVGMETLLNKSDEKDTIDMNIDAEKKRKVVNILRSPLMVANHCMQCRTKSVCEYRKVIRSTPPTVKYICSDKCKDVVVNSLPDTQCLEKPRLYFERLCGMCGTELLSKGGSETLVWQTREFCNKLCLADHIGEVARMCHECGSQVRVLYMAKYCVRFGSDVHQFCSNGCLDKYKFRIKVCCYCQKNLAEVSKVTSLTDKDYCSNKCLKRAQRRDIGQQNYSDKLICTVCNKTSINQYEFLHNANVTWLCTDPCLNVFKYVNQIKSVNCCLCSRLLNAGDSRRFFFIGCQLRVFCTHSCFSVFVISARHIVTCEKCKVKKYNFDMIGCQKDTKVESYFCSIWCLNECKKIEDASTASANQIQSSGIPKSETPTKTQPLLKECSMCTKREPAQFHMVMSDSTLRSFCSFNCATNFKGTFGYQVSLAMQSYNRGKIDGSSSVSDAPKVDDTQKSSAPLKPIFNQKDLNKLMKLFEPPIVSNKSTQCQSNMSTKSVDCQPQLGNKEIQTETDEKAKIDGPSIIPVPVPIYVPTPIMMYNAHTPVPLIIPIPVPVPIFIPTSEKTTKDLEERIKKIMSNYPANPTDSELLMLAEKIDKEDDSEKERTYDDDNTTTEQESVGEEVDYEPPVDFETILPRYHTSVAADSIPKAGDKRKISLDDGKNSKKAKLNQQGSLDEEDKVADWLSVPHSLSSFCTFINGKKGDSEDSNFEIDLCKMSAEMINQSLITYLRELRQPNGECYDADTVLYLLLGLQKHLFEQGSSHCIFLETRFENFTSVLDEVIERYILSSPASIHPFHLKLGTRITEEMLWESRQLGAHTPYVLLNTLFYFNTKAFKLKSIDEHLHLSFDQIVKQWKRSTTEFSCNRLTILKYISKGKTDDDDSCHEIHENKLNPLRCPVKLFEFYLSKCPESVRQNQSHQTYYVYPEHSCRPDSHVWFTSQALDSVAIKKMLNRTILVREVQEALFGED